MAFPCNVGRVSARLAALVMVLAAPLAARADVGVRRQTELPTTSLFDARGLGAGQVRFAFAAGFPYVQAELGVGLSSGLDAVVSVDSLYGAANQVGIGPKLRLAGDDDLALAISLQGQWTYFRNPAFLETSGSARHLTGLRNWGIEPSLILSTRGKNGCIYGVARGQATYATEPETQGPLAGVDASQKWGANVGVYVGGELNPGTALVHVYGEVGLDLHLRNGDLPVLPRLEVGFTFPG